MQFSVLINQLRATEWGLNAQQAILFAYLYGCPAWAETCSVDGCLYFRISKQKVCNDLPLLTDKPNTIHKILKAIEAFGLIKMAVFDNETHVSITRKGAFWNDTADSSSADVGGGEGWKKIHEGVEKNPHRGGKKSTLGVEKNPPNQSISNTSIKLNNYNNTDTPQEFTEIPCDHSAENQTEPDKVDSVTVIFNFWKTTMGHERAKLDDKRKRLITSALKLGYSQADLLLAITGCAKSPHHMGKNSTGTVYDDLSLILRDAGKIDGFIKKSSQVVNHETSKQHDRIGSGAGKPSFADVVRGQAQRTIERFSRDAGGVGVHPIR